MLSFLLAHNPNIPLETYLLLQIHNCLVSLMNMYILCPEFLHQSQYKSHQKQQWYEVMHSYDKYQTTYLQNTHRLPNEMKKSPTFDCELTSCHACNSHNKNTRLFSLISDIKELMFFSFRQGFVQLDHLQLTIVPVRAKEKPAVSICPYDRSSGDYYRHSSFIQPSFNSPHK